MVSVNFNAPAMMNVCRMNHLENNLMRSMQRVSSGERITRSADDVSAHGITERLRAQIRSKNVAARNVQDGIALTNVAEGALNEVHDILHRMRELSIQAANGTYTDGDRDVISLEVKTLKDEINFISENAHYNGHKLLNGTGDWGGSHKGGYLQIESNSDIQIDSISYKIPAVNTASLGLDNMSVDTVEDASAAIDIVKEAVNYISEVRAGLGGLANRLEFSWRNTEKMIEDNQAYESLLRDTDVAAEMITITRDQVIYQYTTAMLAQANQTPQSILQLLK